MATVAAGQDEAEGHAEGMDVVPSETEEMQSEGDDFGGGDPWLGRKPDLGAGAAVQLRLEPGDVVIAHQKIPHRVSPNWSPHIRYMAYFRISSVHHEPTEIDDVGLWTHFEGLAEVMPDREME